MTMLNKEDFTREQLVDQLRAANGEYAATNGANNDARLKRARLMLRIYETFPITKMVAGRHVRGGAREYFADKFPDLTWGSIQREVCFARVPDRLTERRADGARRCIHRSSHALGAIRRGWPHWSPEERLKFRVGVLKIVKEPT